MAILKTYQYNGQTIHKVNKFISYNPFGRRDKVRYKQVTYYATYNGAFKANTLEEIKRMIDGKEDTEEVVTEFVLKDWWKPEWSTCYHKLVVVKTVKNDHASYRIDELVDACMDNRLCGQTFKRFGNFKKHCMESAGYLGIAEELVESCR